MTHPLPLAYPWRMPVAVSTVGLAACVSLLVSQRADGWPVVLGVLVAGWLGLLVVVWVRTRAWLEVDGTRLTVRRVGTKHTIEGADVVAVSGARTFSGPAFRLRTRAGLRQLVPVALLRDGTTTLLRWVVHAAPQATLDSTTRAAIERWRTRGLID